MDKSRYPIGSYQAKKTISTRDVAKWIDDIQELPVKLRSEVSYLTDEQLDTAYREDGWTVRQLVHHIADSHINSYTRFKLALTEDRPSIKPYLQDEWANLPDTSMPVAVSLQLIESLHKRWVVLLKSLDEDQLNRELIHPESGTLVLKSMIGQYAWHGKHHLAHIVNLKEKKDWN
ncbi:putative metal-dependent hydrolase [Aliifodinibius salicampi]|uniref:Metal-dependent hydrolase n=1 Tax=Fodinibius salicampi TaxID=1920655 RepID=A0ABT3Q2E8_9BACT|nr:putative metal-dependent hydrolase [Fodinibius salicampi]MCW9714283.1 putative metal-dependent hydrolase [Fodinibius salicampi]